MIERIKQRGCINPKFWTRHASLVA
jgi:hypothetical protein